MAPADDDDAPPVRGLPVELWAFCAAASVLFLPVLHRWIFDGTPRQVAIALAENLLPFLGIPLAIHACYRFGLQRPLARIRGLGRRMAFHLLVGTAVAAPLSVPIALAMKLLRGDGPRMPGFTAACVVVTWTLVIPAMLVVETRGRAEATRRRLAAQAHATLRAELEALQSRTQPHFLFNALNTIASLIHAQPDLAEATVERLAELLRYGLRSAQKPRVPLGEEFARVRDYLEIQRARFGERLAFELHCPPALETFEVPPLVLLPLVENAVLHGIAPRLEGGRLVVRAEAAATGVALRVRDEGGPKGTPVHEGTGTALDDLRRRLGLLYGERWTLSLAPNDGGGLTADLALPGAAP